MAKSMRAKSSARKARSEEHAEFFASLPESLGPQGKTAAVVAAMGAQLHHEGRWPPNDITKIMASDYLYNQQSLTNFLTAICWNLAHGSPSYHFVFDQALVTKGLGLTVGALMATVDSQTT